MTIQETTEIIYILQATYPNFYNKQTDSQIEILVNFWASCFNDYDINVVLKALTSIIMKKKDFPPNIAEINQEVIKIINPHEEIADGEIGWGKAQNLMKSYGSYLFAEQQTELTKQIEKDYPLKMALLACGGLESLRMCEIDNLNTLRAQFIRIYNSYAKRKQDDLLLPNNLKADILQIQEENIKKANNVISFIADKLSVYR